jgi:predicted O-methyltransferase YrrM
MSKYNFDNINSFYSALSSIQNFINPLEEIHVLEIGSYKGSSACLFSDLILLHDLSTLTCVDPFDINDKTTQVQENTRKIFYDNIKLSSNFNKIIVKEMYSKDFYLENNNIYDLIYIDGSHELEDITLDFKNCLKILKKGGILWMDDYGGGDPPNSIRNHIDILIKETEYNLEIIYKGYQIAFKKI